MRSQEASGEIEERATQWAARLDRAPLTEEEQAGLDAWLAGDSRRIGAYALARATFIRADAARALETGYNPDNFIERESQPEQDNRFTRRRLIGGGAAAIAASALGIVGINIARRERYVTSRGEMLRVALGDKSIVNLNTASTLDVQFTPRQRTVLLQTGEALFDVAKDAERPFRVIAGATDVRAVGTSFTVRRETDDIVLIVVNEGIVEVSHSGGTAQPVRLTQNMSARVDARAPMPIAVASIDPANVRRNLFWREGKIGFSDATLSDAAAEFARYSNIAIVIPDPEVARQRITGMFTATDPAGFAEAAASSLGLAVYRSGETISLAKPMS